MQLFHTIKELQYSLTNKRRSNIKVALVPTMGNLHAGHLSLVELAKRHADVVVVSIFVNPTQFGVGEDFDRYPRTLHEDLLLLSDKADIIFTPTVEEMYPTYPPAFQLLAGDISKILCGKTRPTHFDGVGLVVSKLFNIVRPDVAIFGKKDYQQLAIIHRLNEALNFNIEIIGGEIVRADDGLALSSRNSYLTDKERKIAPYLGRMLTHFAGLLQKHATPNNFGELKHKLTKEYCDRLTAAGFGVDYLEVLNLDLSSVDDFHQQTMVILTACYLGKTRLLDNVEVDFS